MPDAFVGLQPAGLWEHFDHITRIPRPSGREAAISQHIETWAREHGFLVRRDAIGNLSVQVPASPGLDGAPPIALQAHLDMVCAREEGCAADPARGKIQVVRDGEWIKAQGSTLGADNGIAIAAMLYLAETGDVTHGPLDLVFTVLEETTSGGADALDPRLVRSKVLLNLDSEEDGVLVVGAAGGIWSVLRWSAPMSAAPAGWSAMEIAVSGLLGGHSGSDINKHRLNAIQGLLRLLQEAAKNGQFSLGALEGGDAFNAIPRQARAVIYAPNEAKAELGRAISLAKDELAGQYLRAEPGLAVRIHTPAADPASAYSPADSRRLLDMLRVIPCGVLAMDQEIPGLVETSNSLGVVSMEGATATIECFTRSSVTPAMHGVVDSIQAAARLGGAEFSIVPPEGPCWEVDPSSRLLAEARSAYHRLFGEDPRLLAVHGFLECALIKKQIPGLDIASIGPEIQDAHKPGERVHIGSVDRFIRLITEMLRALATPARSRGPHAGSE